MIKPDIIVAWPRNVDYPLWREAIRKHRSQYNEIIVVFTESNQGEDYREFIREAMFKDHILFVDNPPIKSNEDWRNVAIHTALLHSYNAAWVFFTEQDFTMKPGFWEYVDEQINNNNYEAMVVMDSGRIHPCGILIRRDALNKTRKEFGVVPDKLDHFGLFQKDLENPELHISTGIIPENLYYHMNGLSHNMTLIYNKQPANWRVDEFRQYLADCLRVTVPQDQRFRWLALTYLEQNPVKSEG